MRTTLHSICKNDAHIFVKVIQQQQCYVTTRLKRIYPHEKVSRSSIQASPEGQTRPESKLIHYAADALDTLGGHERPFVSVQIKLHNSTPSWIFPAGVVAWKRDENSFLPSIRRNTTVPPLHGVSIYKMKSQMTHSDWLWERGALGFLFAPGDTYHRIVQVR